MEVEEGYRFLIFAFVILIWSTFCFFLGYFLGWGDADDKFRQKWLTLEPQRDKTGGDEGLKVVPPMDVPSGDGLRVWRASVCDETR